MQICHFCPAEAFKELLDFFHGRATGDVLLGSVFSTVFGSLGEPQCVIGAAFSVIQTFLTLFCDLKHLLVQFFFCFTCLASKPCVCFLVGILSWVWAKILEFHFLPPAIWPCWWLNARIQWAISLFYIRADAVTSGLHFASGAAILNVTLLIFGSV